MSNVNAVLYLNKKRRLRNFHPQGHTAPTKVIPQGNITNSGFTLDNDALFSAELLVTSIAQGTIFSLGTTTAKVLLAVDAAQLLDVQVGDVGSPPLTNGANAANVVLPIGVPFHLAWACNISAAGAKELIVWINGAVAVRKAIAGTVAAWADANAGLFVQADAGIVALSSLKYYARRVTV